MPQASVDLATQPSLFENSPASKTFDTMTDQLQQMNDKLGLLVKNQQQANSHLDNISDAAQATAQKDFTFKNTNNMFSSINSNSTIFGAATDNGTRGGRFSIK